MHPQQAQPSAAQQSQNLQWMCRPRHASVVKEAHEANAACISPMQRLSGSLCGTLTAFPSDALGRKTLHFSSTCFVSTRAGSYIDHKCPFTGNVSIRGRILSGAPRIAPHWIYLAGRPTALVIVVACGTAPFRRVQFAHNIPPGHHRHSEVDEDEPDAHRAAKLPPLHQEVPAVRVSAHPYTPDAML